MRPLIGISAHQLPVTDGDAQSNHYVVNRAYVRAVRKAGGVPLLLPLVEDGDAAELLDRVDGLLMTGGGDVDPHNYGAAPDPRTSRVDPERDGWDISLCKIAVERDLPTLAICRGAQILNVALGGTLVQHIDKHFDRDLYNETAHDVTIEESSAVSSWLGPRVSGNGELGVNTLHHQAVEVVGAGARVVAYAGDGTIEAIEVDSGRAIGVQWHPELLRHRPEHLALFASLVRLASS